MQENILNKEIIDYFETTETKVGFLGRTYQEAKRNYLYVRFDTIDAVALIGEVKCKTLEEVQNRQAPRAEGRVAHRHRQTRRPRTYRARFVDGQEVGSMVSLRKERGKNWQAYPHEDPLSVSQLPRRCYYHHLLCCEVHCRSSPATRRRHHLYHP